MSKLTTVQWLLGHGQSHTVNLHELHKFVVAGQQAAAVFTTKPAAPLTLLRLRQIGSSAGITEVELDPAEKVIAFERDSGNSIALTATLVPPQSASPQPTPQAAAQPVAPRTELTSPGINLGTVKLQV